MINIKWSIELPKKEGYYWFYGKMWSSKEDELYIIKVRKISNGYLYIYANEGLSNEDMKGRFLKIEEPIL